ncbi:MAG TPA: cytochrome c oxidase subunit II [Noviherbaspirillum sp.]
MRKTSTPSHFIQSKKQTIVPRLGAVLLLSGCSGVQSALAPGGPHAQSIANIGWVMFIGAAAILLLVMALALYTIYRNPDRRAAPKANTLIAAGGVVLPVVALSALLLYGVSAMGSLRATSVVPTVHIDIVGNRWWWDVHYRGTNGETIVTANEIRIPAGKPVMLSLRTNDVIHSFWVPNLAGKIDLIPGRTNHLLLQADHPGTFRGQCAEYCGAQHARMALHVIAETPPEYEAWLARQRAPAQAPGNGLALRGRDAFVTHCIACHTVRGIANARERGPDLTHVASRHFLAAGNLPNNRDNLLAIIARSQDIKPGNAMPSQDHLDEDTLQAIASFLETLD